MARKILLADDSVTAQNMGRKILLDAGYDVITVNNGSAALKKIDEIRPDLIVLDVYMPGYSGLEVCQRVKEDEDTARIPVLLTVGKLEPFKPEEARKARADAYIVKPFEASELLVALTKLEDKVVPPPGPGKAGRTGKPVSEQSFGDSESGWKKRLRFPTPASKAAIQPQAESSSQPESQSASAALPKDITPEEVAAITAAAAQISESPEPTAIATQSSSSSERSSENAAPAVVAGRPWPTQEPSPANEPAETEATPPSAEMPTATFAGAMEAQAESASAPVEMMAPKVDEAAASGPSVTDSTVQAVSPGSESTAHVEEWAEVSQGASDSVVSSVSETAAIAAPAPTDDEVLAALRTLSPVDDQVAAKTDAGAQSAEPKVEDNPMAAGVSASAETGATIIGPRWIAEPVAVDAAEGTLILEHEMEKAHAAFAAADAARARIAGASRESVSVAGVEASVVGSEAAQPIREAEASVAEANNAALAPQPEPVSAEPTESKSELAEAHHETSVIPEPVAAPEVAASVAASASGGEWRSPAVSAAMSHPASKPLDPGDTAASHKPDLQEAEINAASAAAWANWTQIRNTVVAASSHAADAVAAGLNESRQEAPPQFDPKAADHSPASSASSAPSSSATEASAIASIVESVLSELKPKLVEEIARKMASERKKE